MGSKRRYHPIGRHPEYDERFDHLRVTSPILNIEERKFSFTYSGAENDLSYLQALKLEWAGDEQGEYVDEREGRVRFAKLPGVRREIQELERRWKVRQQQLAKQGRPTSEKMPLTPTLLQLQARQDVLTEELEWIEERIQKIEAGRRTEHKSMMLRYGVRGRSRLQDGRIAELDGQTVQWRRFGTKEVPVIVEPDSPYHGMSCPDYFEMHKVHAKVKRAIRRAQEKARNRLLLQGIRDEQQIKQAEHQAKQALMDEHPEWKKLFALRVEGRRRVHRDFVPMPEWPEGVRNYLTDPPGPPKSKAGKPKTKTKQ